MKKENVTCVQRAQFVLHFFENGEWRDKKESLYDTFVKKKKPTAEELSELATYTTRCMTRVSELYALLLSIHDDWEITPKRDCIILETETMDFETIIPLIKASGFNENDYVLYSEYTRKWGML